MQITYGHGSPANERHAQFTDATKFLQAARAAFVAAADAPLGACIALEMMPGDGNRYSIMIVRPHRNHGADALPLGGGLTL